VGKALNVSEATKKNEHFTIAVSPAEIINL
jgi:hypothetical protein